MNKKDSIAVDEVMQFLRAFVDYHIVETPIEPDAPTDAQMLEKNIPVLERLLTEKPKRKRARKPKTMSYSDYDKVYDADQTFKNYVDARMRYARESVNPNYKYCVCHDSFGSICLTDDLDAAMQFASTQSKLNTRTGYNVMKIVQKRDGTYVTVKECWYRDGEYYDGDGSYFLHYNYIAQNAFEINKL